MNWQEGIFGAGWVWSAIGTTLVVVSLFGIYRQLQSAGAANALQRIQTLQAQWDSPRMVYAKLATAEHLKAGHHDEATFFRAQPILDFFVNLDDLEKAGHIGIAEIDHIWGYPIDVYVALLGPTMETVRRRLPGTYSTDTLMTKLHAYQRRQGQAPLELDAAAKAELLEFTITFNAARLEQEIAWRSAMGSAADEA